MAKKATNIEVKDTVIRTLQQDGIDYVCITDIARQKNAEEPKDVVKNWMRLKEEEQKQIGWSAKRELSKINYRIHTDAIKQSIVPDEIDAYHKSLIYAEEADVLNVAMFGMTAKEWRDANPDKKGTSAIMPLSTNC